MHVYVYVLRLLGICAFYRKCSAFEEFLKSEGFLQKAQPKKVQPQKAQRILRFYDHASVQCTYGSHLARAALHSRASSTSDENFHNSVLTLYAVKCSMH